MPSGYYYFGGYDMRAKELTVLMVEPGKHPRVTTLKDANSWPRRYRDHL